MTRILPLLSKTLARARNSSSPFNPTNTLNLTRTLATPSTPKALYTPVWGQEERFRGDGLQYQYHQL
jgi:hypothetical protein